MIQKLKWRFVLALMLVVTLLLSIGFGAIYLTARASARRTAVDLLKRSLSSINNGVTAYYDPQSSQVPHFTVCISPTGQVSRLSGNLGVNDELLLQICVACLAEESGEGVLKEFGLRYMRTTVYGEIRIAFADMSFENSILRGLTRGLVAVGAGALAVFFGLSVLLSSVAVKPIRRAWERQRQFVADASHELNTPLAVISSNLELLSEAAELSPENAARVDRVRAESDRMKQLTGELLTLARTENDADKKAPGERFSASDSAMRQALLFEPLLFEEGLGFEYKLEQDISVFGNEAQFTQLTAILLDNARKHAAPGSVITLSLARAGRRTAALSVRNDGAVIPPEQLANIFERFYRADASRTGGGYGLGLSIARAAAQANRWSLSAESAPQLGTVFTLTFSPK